MNLGNVCRSCLVETTIDDSFSLTEFAYKTEKITFRDVFEDISNYQVQPFEPHRLCENCGVRLLEIFTFRKSLAETQTILEKLLSATVSPTAFKRERLKTEQDTDEERQDLQMMTEYDYNEQVIEQEVFEQEMPEEMEEELEENQEVHVKQEEEMYEESHLDEEEEEEDDGMTYEVIAEGIELNNENEQYVMITKIQEPFLEPETIKQSLAPQKPYIREDGVLVDKLGREQKCLFCGSQHTTHASLLRHMRIKHPEMQTVPCEHCDKKMFTEADRTYHYRVCEKLREVRSVTEYPCPHCGILVIGANKLRSHINSVHRNRTPNLSPFICDLCNKQLKNKHCLQVHMKIQHIDVQTFKCDHCKESYKSISGLKYHVAQYHSENTVSFSCSLCDFETKQEFLLKRHIKRHNPDKSYECDQCERTFASLDSLKSHQYSHTTLRPFCCTTCSKSFKSKAKLRNHMKSHEDKRYECPVCTAWYMTNQALRHHMQRQHADHDLPPPGTVLCDTKAQLPKRIIRLELR